MDHEPLPNDVMSAIEACRPDHDDERLPEVAAALADVSPVRVAELRRSVGRIDRAITAVVHRVPVPDGLAERVLVRIHDDDVGSAAPDVGVVALPETERRGRRWRRSWWMAGAGMAIAASLLVVLVVWPRRTIELAEIQAQARDFYEADDHRATLTSKDFPTSLGGVTLNTVRGWRRVSFLDRAGVAYELINRQRVKATLYVVPLNGWFRPKLDVPPAAAGQSTLGRTIAVWTDGAEVYVLVIEGGGRLQSFISPSLA